MGKVTGKGSCHDPTQGIAHDGEAATPVGKRGEQHADLADVEGNIVVHVCWPIAVAAADEVLCRQHVSKAAHSTLADSPSLT